MAIEILDTLRFFGCYEVKGQRDWHAAITRDMFDRIVSAIGTYPDCTHIVRFVNETLDSSQLGRETYMPVGPSNTVKTLEECDGKPLGNLPSNFQYARTATPVHYKLLSIEEHTAFSPLFGAVFFNCPELSRVIWSK